MTTPTEALRARLAAESAMQAGRGDHHLSRLLDEAADALAQQASVPSAEPAAWMDQEAPRDPIGSAKKRDLETINGEPGRAIAAKYTVPLYAGAAPLMANGLTPQETAQTASVAGLVHDDWDILGMEASRKC